MYTSCFKYLSNIGFPVSICRYPPKSYEGPSFVLLAPEDSDVVRLRSLSKKSRVLFNEELNKFRTDTLDYLDMSMVIQQICRFYPGIPIEYITLICYEDNPLDCHRSVVAKWFTEYGYATKEREFSRRIKRNPDVYAVPPFNMVMAETNKLSGIFI